jgi:VCBS repeat-containing protein
VVLTFTVQVSDGNGGLATQDVKITIGGANDSPVITSGVQSGLVTEIADGATGENTATHSLSGAVTFTDVNLSDIETSSISNTQVVATLSNGYTLSAAQRSALVNAFTIDAATHSTTDGSGSIGWHYNINDLALDFLGKNDQVVLTFTVQVSDGNGGLATQDVKITIGGAEDAPTITASSTTATGSFGEMTGVVGSTALDSASGSIAFADVDLSDAHTVSQAAPTFNWSGGTLSASQIAALTSASTLTLTKTDSTGTGSGSVAWSYSAQDQTFDFLGTGQRLTITYQVTIDDSQGGTAIQNVVVTVIGTDDTPTTDLNGGGAGTNTTASFVQGTPVPIAPSATVSDVDSPTFQSMTITLTTRPDGSAESLSPNAAALALIATDHLAWSYTASTGVLSIMGSASQADYQAILQGILYNDTSSAPNPTDRLVTVVVSDGELSSASNNITISVTPTNDPNDFDSQATGAGLVGTTFFGTPGPDIIPALNQAQIIYGGAGDDQISGGNSGTGETIYGGSGNDVIFGGNGGDTIYGGSGNDTIDGGEGKDTIIGGFGADTLTGGLANDVFKYLSVTDSHGGQADTITDFSPGNDKIDFTAFAATAFTVFKTGALATATSLVAAHTVAWFFDSAHNQTIVYANPTGAALNGGSSSLLEIHLTGVSSVQAGDFLTANPLNLIAPAGVAGEPINLGLAAPSSAEDGTLVTATIADVPSGWTLSGGTLLEDGTWTAQTSDLSALSITSPANFAGAIPLKVTQTWMQADGTTATMNLTDNVEAYAAGSPIFAWSGNDFLSASSGKDQFVFAQPIGNDTIYNFDPSQDQIDLISYAGFSNFDDVQSHLTADANGNAVITLANGQTITLDGVAAASISASNFVFDQMPVTNNAGTMTISDGAVLPLSGIVNNTGTIALDSIGNNTHLELIQYGITLQGGGQMMLSDSDENFISGTIPSVTLTNVDNTISGAGHLGAGQMTLVNDGTIVATGSHALVIDTGANAVTNIGTLEATGSGGLMVNSDVANAGLIWAYGGNITINGAVTGSGSAMINATATLEFGAASSNDVTFAANAAGTLTLDHSLTQPFSAVISGLGADDTVDLKDFAFTNGNMTVSTSLLENGNTTLVVSNTSTGQSTTLTLAGDYTHSGWHFAQDSSGTGTIFSDLPTTATPQVASTSTAWTGTSAGDTFVFAANFGQETITNFHPETDVIEINHTVFADVQALLAATHDDGHGSAVITADPHHSITIENVTVAQLVQHQGDFHFT